MTKRFANLRRHEIYPVIAFLFFVLFFGGAYLSGYTGEKKQDQKQLLTTQGYADQILSVCSGASYRPTCYEEEVPKLMPQISMEQSFEVVRLIQNKDREYTYCHVLGHKLSAKETAKDPSRWKEVVARSPSGLCSNGSIHGAFQERFRTEALTDEEIEIYKPDFQDVCEAKANWKPTGLEQGTCYHAVGHLLMYITEADIHKSLKLCDDIAIKDEGRRNYSQLCYDGAFMQIFQPLEPEDFDLIKGKQPKKEELADFCGQFDGDEIGPCWNEGWPLFRAELLLPGGVVDHCSRSILKEEADQNRCYLALFYVLTAQFSFDETKISDFCNALPLSKKGQCFANAASRMIETDYRNTSRATTLCTGVNDPKSKGQCFDELVKYSTYNFHPGSSEALSLCAGLPDPWKEDCLGKQP